MKIGYRKSYKDKGMREEFKLWARRKNQEGSSPGICAKVYNGLRLWWASSTLFSYIASKLNRHEPERKRNILAWLLLRLTLMIMACYVAFVVMEANYELIRTEKS